MKLDKQKLAKILSVLSAKENQQDIQQEPSVMQPINPKGWTSTSVFGSKIPNPSYTFENMTDLYNKKFYSVGDIARMEGNKTYDYNNSIALKTGKYNLAKVPKQLIDDVIDTAKRKGIDPYDLLALIGQESTFGGGLDILSKGRGEGGKQALVSGWNLTNKYNPEDPYMYLANHKAEGIDVNKTIHGWQAYVQDEAKLKEWVKKNPSIISEYINKVSRFEKPKEINYFDEAADFIKTKGFQAYNAGDSDYSNKIKKSKQLLLADPELRKYLSAKK